MQTAKFFYEDGTEMMVGDKVLVDNKEIAFVDLIFTPGTEIAKAYGCADSPGFALKYGNGNYIVWNTTDFDLVLLKRKDERARKRKRGRF